METVQLKSNEFWGRRSGFIHPKWGPVFKGRRGSLTARQEHTGPCGYKLKRFRNYANKKLRHKIFG